MKRDELYRSVIRNAIDEELSFLDERPSLHTAIMSKIEGEKKVKRRTSMTFVMAAMMVLLLGSMAVAAGFGLFGQLRAQKVDTGYKHPMSLTQSPAPSLFLKQRTTSSENVETNTV